ncbi:MAG: gliding motility-associated C-terminal domain-containing protein [Bacteroidia bacterium]|nr:gliding motility-associated C-terminal domain-containing protein [Bacteroidia bacterium]
MPEAFSPNADGVNDVFFIKGLKVFDKAQFIVFNRNGQVVFDSGNGYKNDWAGTNNSNMPGIGSDLPEGLYYYVFKPNGLKKEDVTGNLYIKR